MVTDTDHDGTDTARVFDPYSDDDLATIRQRPGRNLREDRLRATIDERDKRVVELIEGELAAMALVLGHEGHIETQDARIAELEASAAAYQHEVETGRNEQHDRLVAERETLRAEVGRLKANTISMSDMMLATSERDTLRTTLYKYMDDVGTLRAEVERKQETITALTSQVDFDLEDECDTLRAEVERLKGLLGRYEHPVQPGGSKPNWPPSAMIELARNEKDNDTLRERVKEFAEATERTILERETLRAEVGRLKAIEAGDSPDEIRSLKMRIERLVNGSDLAEARKVLRKIADPTTGYMFRIDPLEYANNVIDGQREFASDYLAKQREAAS